MWSSILALFWCRSIQLARCARYVRPFILSLKIEKVNLILVPIIIVIFTNSWIVSTHSILLLQLLLVFMEERAQIAPRRMPYFKSNWRRSSTFKMQWKCECLLLLLALYAMIPFYKVLHWKDIFCFILKSMLRGPQTRETLRPTSGASVNIHLSRYDSYVRRFLSFYTNE